MKKIRNIVTFLLVIAILVSNNNVYALASKRETSTVAQNPNVVTLKSVHSGVQILQFNKLTDKASVANFSPSQLMWTDTLGNTYPAYCLNPNNHVKDYKVTIKKNLKQVATASISDTGARANKVMAALQAGWPAKKPAELGFTSSSDAKNNYQAYYATKMAVWAIIHKKYSDLDSFTINPSVKGYQSDKVLAAMKQIVAAGLKNSVITTPKIRVLDNDPSQIARRDGIDTESLSEAYTVFGLPEGTNYKVSFTKPQTNGAYITNMSNKKIKNNTFTSSEGFKVIVPASALKEGTFTCSIKVQGIVAATKVVYMQSSNSKVNQNYAGVTTANISATAKFTADPSKVSLKAPLVTVNFDTGDAPKITPLSVEKGQALGSLPVTTSETGSFVGWYTDKSLTKQFFNDTPVVNNMTVYPKFISAEMKPTDYVDSVHFIRDCDPDFTITIKSSKPITTENLSKFATIEEVINTAPPLEVMHSSKASDEYIISAKGGWPLGGLFSLHLIDESITFVGLDPQVRSESFELKAAPAVNKLDFKSTDKFIPSSDVTKVNDTTYNVKSKYGPFKIGDVICVSDNNDKKTNLFYGKIVTDLKKGDVDLITIEKPRIEDILNSMEYNSGIQDVTPNIVDTKQIEQDIVKQAYKSQGMNQIFTLLGAATAATPTFINDSMKYNGSYVGLTFPAISPSDISCSIQTVGNSSFDDYPTTNDSEWCLLTLKGKVTRKINQISVSSEVTITQAVALRANTEASWHFGDLAPNINEKVYVCLDTKIDFSVKLSLDDKEDGTIDLTPQVQEAMKTGVNLISGNADTANQNLPPQNLTSTFTMSNAIANLKKTLGEAPNYVNVVDQEIMKPKTSIDGIIDIEFPISFVVNVELLAGLTSNTHLLSCDLFTVTCDSDANVNVTKEEYLPFRYNQDVFAYGAFGVQCGLKGGINIGPAGITSELHIGASIEVGAYLEVKGFFHFNVTNYLPGRVPDGENFTFYTYKKPQTQLSGGMYIEIGVYCDIALEAQTFEYKANQSLFGIKIPIVSFGTKNFMEFFENNPSYLHLVGGSLDPISKGIYNSKWFDIEDLSETDYKNNIFPAGVDKKDFKIYFDDSRFKIADNGCIVVDLSQYHQVSGKEYAVANMTVVYTGNKLSFGSIRYTIPVLYDKEKIDTKGENPLTVYKVNYLINGDIAYTEKVYVGHKALGFSWSLQSDYEMDLMRSITDKYKDRYEPFRLIPPSNPIYKNTNVNVDLKHKVRNIAFQYLDKDGKTWLWTDVLTNYGEIPVPPVIPTANGCTPRGWDKVLTAASDNSPWGYLMNYDSKLCTITFVVPSYTAFGKTFPSQTYTSQQQFGRTLRYPDGMGLGSGKKGIMITFPDANVFVDSVTGDKTYTGVVNFGIDTVKFVDHDDKVIDTQTGPYGSKLNFPTKIPQPIVENGNTYTFDYWYPNPSMDPTYAYFTGDLTYSPVYKFTSSSTAYPTPAPPTTSTITFNAGDGFFGNSSNKAVTKTYQNGTVFSDASADIIPQKPSDNNYTYTFNGWGTFTISNSTSLTATYTAHMIPYTAIMDANGGQFDGGSTMNSFLLISYDNANAMPQTFKLIPTKVSDANVYTFVGWEKKVEGNNEIRYLAKYDTAPNMCSITLNGNGGLFTDEKGNSVSQLVVTAQYGTTAVLPIPYRASTNESDYTWSGYVLSENGLVYGNQIIVQGNATYNAQYTPSVKYDVTFNANGGTFAINSSSTKTVLYTYNTNLINVEIEAPIKADDADYSYVFTGWSPTLGTVTEATTYTAQYSSRPKAFSVTFNANGGTFASNSSSTKTVTYPSGTELQSISIETPTKADDADYSYDFIGWSPTLGTVTENAVYTANYSTIPKHHGLTISNGTNTEDVSTSSPTISGYTYGVNTDGILELSINDSGLTLSGNAANINVVIAHNADVTFKNLTIDNSSPTGDVRSGIYISGNLTIEGTVNFPGTWIMIAGELTGGTLNVNNAAGSSFNLCPGGNVNIHDITINLIHTSIDGSDMLNQMTLDNVILNITDGKIWTLDKDIVIQNHSVVTFLTTGEVIKTYATVTITGNSTVNFAVNTGINIVDKHDFGANTTVSDFMNDANAMYPGFVHINYDDSNADAQLNDYSKITIMP